MGLRYDDLLAVFESQAAFSAHSNVAKRIRNALNFADDALSSDDAKLLRNRTIIQSFLTLICSLLKAGEVSGHEQRVGTFFINFLSELTTQVQLGHQANETDYIEFQRTVNANVRTGAAMRQRILLRKLLASDPGFAAILDPTAVATSGLEAAIASDATKIVKLVGQHNERYSAQHGADLFKATNKTAQAHANMGKPLRAFEDYKAFIDSLYFLFHESVGTRLGGNTPASFGDVNTLRTDLRHDVDHGKAGKVRAKKKKLGSVFQRFSGVSSPNGLDPNLFIVVQSNILAELKRDLTSMTL